MKKITDYLFEIPASGHMRVPGRIYTTEKMLPHIQKDNAAQQVANVACLPGILNYSMAMPDIHWGYGFPIGGVAAFDMDEGVISPGGVGYDINCGVRLLKSNLIYEDVQTVLPKLIEALYRKIPSGVGSKGALKLSAQQEKKVLQLGATWAVQNGFGKESDLEKIEENGEMPGAVPELVSQHALERGRPQLGTLGSGNHFIEVGVVREVYDEHAAAILGLRKGQITLLIHCGSRGLGHQVCSDYVNIMQNAAEKYGFYLPDRQLACAPVRSPEGQEYLSAMSAAVNYAFANRQLITHWAREAFREVLGASDKSAALSMVYEVAHNIAKIEEHEVNGSRQKVCVHRKGATRAFAPHSPEIPAEYRDIGQPVLLPGDMGRYSYVLVGTEKAMQETFGSTSHGAGRVLSRSQAKKVAKGRNLRDEMSKRGIVLRAASYATIAEEMPDAYKDVADVVDAVVGAGLAKKVVKLKPLGVVKG